MSINTKRSEKALQHLKSLKPYDGWSLDSYTNATGEKLVMIKRRNIPLYKKGLQCIAYDELDTKCIIGITSSIGDTGKTMYCRGVVLVDKNGDVVRDQKDVRIRLNKMEVDSVKREKEVNEARKATRKNIQNARNATQRQQNERSSGGSAGNNNSFDATNLSTLSEEQTTEMAKLGLYLIGGLTILRIIASVFFSVYVVVLPLIILYAMSTCPKNDSFDAKKELKRVLRGHHLPENHPNKPKDDWLSNTIARVTASVATELATSLGYELSFISLFGGCTLTTVIVPSVKQEFFWIGIFEKWHYVYKREIEVD